MGTTKTVGTTLVKFGLGAAFVGLGVLGVVLIAMAAVLPGAIAKRIAVSVIGVGGIVIAVGFVRAMRNRPGDGPT